jgi:hypothetical protein
MFTGADLAVIVSAALGLAGVGLTVIFQRWQGNEDEQVGAAMMPSNVRIEPADLEFVRLELAKTRDVLFQMMTRFEAAAVSHRLEMQSAAMALRENTAALHDR